VKFSVEDVAALDVLIGVCDRRLGANAAPSRELRRLREQLSDEAYSKARRVFDALPADLRRGLDEQSRSTARVIAAQGFSKIGRRLGLIAALNNRRF
jgi:hypothetical protein